MSTGPRRGGDGARGASPVERGHLLTAETGAPARRWGAAGR